MAALFAGLALFFLYDGIIGYPKDNFHAGLFDAFDAGRSGGELNSLNEKTLGRNLRPEDQAELKAAFESGARGGSWAAFAAERHLGEAKPEPHPPESIRQQFHFAGVMAVLLAGVAVVALIHRKRCLRAGADWLETPSGRRVHFSEIHRIDFSKWDRGLAIVEISGGEQRNRRFKLDDYKYSGAAKILDRIHRNRPEVAIGNWPNLIPAAPGTAASD